MSFSTSNLEKYRIPLDEILRVTENFSSETLIGDGGFGMVHKGQLSEEWQKRTVAIKRLNRNEKCFGDADKPQFLLDVVRSCYDDEKNGARPDKLIDPLLKDHIDIKSFHTFNKIAHECVSLKLEQRPPMAKIIRKIEQALNIELKHEESPSTSTTRSLNSFLIPLEEINLATQNFDQKTRIGDYNYGAVHRGQFYGRWQNRTMAITRPTYHKPEEHVSDLYSFGVIMFEMLSGRRAHDLDRHADNPEQRFDLLQEYYRNNELDQFIHYSIIGQTDSRCLNILKETAYRCIKRSFQSHLIMRKYRGPSRIALTGRDKRPPFTMDEVVERIEDAADFEGNEN
ncbi:hypothetical protein L1887_18471 [Cichorium endivia]|nr:hypothetical protein L1887_18471 [Cichorium endivia]